MTNEQACRFCRQLAMGMVLCLLTQMTVAQNCPPNIDFENGSFDHWTSFTGNTTAFSGQNQINLSATGAYLDRQTMIASVEGGVDPYGGFPVNCPNGSGYSIKLGNNRGGAEAEGIAYEFTIPPGQNEYSLIYHYAVVFEDPNHEVYQQPRMVVEITNVTDNDVIDCASFYFVPYGNILPGFFQSDLTGFEGTPVWCKDWSAVTINLDNLAGKTIRLFFKTADCTFRRHFGYAYIDVNSECSSEFTGATYCPDDTAVTVVAPYGYQSYKWFNSNFTQVLGTGQSIRFEPLPRAGTVIAVQIIPYDGYGCTDTLFARLIDTLKLKARAGPDRLYCGEDPVPLGAIPKPGLVYRWFPSEGLTNPDIANPLASPSETANYVLSLRNSGGGCRTADTVLVQASALEGVLRLEGKPAFCITSSDSAVLHTGPADSIEWYRNEQSLHVQNPRLRVHQSGSYHAVVWDQWGCRRKTDKQAIAIEEPQKGIRYPTKFAVNNRSQNLLSRDFGGGLRWRPATFLNDSTTAHPVFNGSRDQDYLVRLQTPGGCLTTDTAFVKIVPEAEIFVPTAFTPNGDGRNDQLQPVLMGMEELRYFRVFNRWGDLLFETKTEGVGWNGYWQGQLQPTATVVWVAEGRSVDGRSIVRKGSSVLIR